MSLLPSISEMVISDHSEADEENLDKLELSSESIDSVIKKKRPRIEENIDELELLTDSTDFTIIKKKLKIEDYIDEAKNLFNKNSINEYNTKNEKHIIYSENDQNVNETFLYKSSIPMEEEKELNKSVKQENKNELSSLKNEDSIELNNKDIEKINDKDIENKIKSFKELFEKTTKIPASKSKKILKDIVAKKEDNEIIIEEQEDKKNEIKKEHIIKSETTDTEVVDGLELSVECASDKEESSSENEDEKAAKPRPKTVIVKAEPNESELECGLSEEEKYNLPETTDIPETKSEKKKTKKKDVRTSFNKIKNSESEDNQNNISDEDYSLRIKRKIKKSPEIKRSTKRVVELKRGEKAKNSHKKSTQYPFDNKNGNTSVEKADKYVKSKIKEFLEKQSSVDKSENNSNSEDEEISIKSKSTRRSNRLNEINQKDNKQIQKLKRYLSIAGIRIKHSALTDCKDNATRIKYLKELLEKNGVNGRPTLEKCKRAREENERMQEISELDVSNIISEGRITRARRNIGNDRKAISLDTLPRHREIRNIFKRIQTVIDSDSE